MNTNARSLGAILAALLLAALPMPQAALGASPYIVRPHTMGNHRVGEIRIGRGIACYRDGRIGPPSFLLADLGKRGVPRISARDAAHLRTRFGGQPAETLRFISLPLITPHLVVFNATVAALCDPDVPPFKDLNGSCNQYYSPLEDMDRTSAAPDCS